MNNEIQKDRSKWIHPLLLLGWLAIGIALRFANLGRNFRIGKLTKAFAREAFSDFSSPRYWVQSL